MDYDIPRQSLHTSAGVLSLVALFVLGSCITSFVLVALHKNNWHIPLLQRKVVGIAWMPPIYAVSSWLSLAFPDKSLYFNIVRDCYEAYVVYLFFALCVAFIAQDESGQQDPSKVILVLQERERIEHPWPVNKCYNGWNLETDSPQFLRKCKENILQFVVIKPLAGSVAICLELVGLYKEGTLKLNAGYFYLSFIQNVSVSLSLYYLVMFYVSTKVALTPFSPIPKFLCIKVVLFVTFWQSVFLSILCQFKLVAGVKESTQLQNLFICFEMFVASAFHHHAFRVADFKKIVVAEDDGQERGRPLQRLSDRPEQHRDSGQIRDVLPWGGTGLREDFNEVSPIVISGGTFRSHVVAQDTKVYVPSPFGDSKEPLLDEPRKKKKRPPAAIASSASSSNDKGQDLLIRTKEEEDENCEEPSSSPR